MTAPRYSRSSLWLALSLAGVVGIMVAHYWTDVSLLGLHNVYRRLAYLPIIIAAFAFGLRGGLLTGLVACLAYLPHAFFMHHHMDPAPPIDKSFEMALYLVMGGLTGWLVDHRQHMEQRLTRSLDEREALKSELVSAGKMSALGQLAAGLAHEIRNPLASILGSAESLAEELDPAHRKHRLAQLLLKEIHRLNRVVSDFVQFARPTPPRSASFDLVALVQEVLQLSEGERKQADVHVAIELSPSLTVHADRDQIAQVLLNLLLNAYQSFSTPSPPAPERPPSLRIVHRPGGSDSQPLIGIGLLDNGAGIPIEHRDEVFNPYFSLRQDGTGIGLSISSRIIDSHGGFMEITDEEGWTAVWFYLPATDHAHDDKDPAGRR